MLEISHRLPNIGMGTRAKTMTKVVTPAVSYDASSGWCEVTMCVDYPTATWRSSCDELRIYMYIGLSMQA